MNKKQLNIHIGMGKTGTTALQNFFWDNRQVLAKNGICYPRLGVQSGAHHLLSPHHPPFLKDVWKFIHIDRWAPKLAKSREEKILLSSELMAWAAYELAVEYCKTAVQWFDTRVVIYLRRQDNLLMAAYNQMVKTGVQIRDINTVLENQFARIDYEKKLAPWKEILGEENIIVRPYEGRQFYQGDIRRDFLHGVFGMDIDSGYKLVDGNSNPRLCYAAMEYKRLINNLINDNSESSKFNELLLDYSAATDESTSSHFSAQALLSPKDRISILERSEPVNSMIARKYLRRADGRLFHDPWPDIDEPWTGSELNESEIVSINSYIFEREPKLIKLAKSGIEEGLKAKVPAKIYAARLLGRSMNMAV